MAKDNLIKALKLSIHALETGIVKYEWNKNQTCNCGVVAQAILGKTHEELLILISPTGRMVSKKINPHVVDGWSATWKQCVQETCSITGETTEKIFKQLFKAGMSPEDITHLEYLENPAILKRANLYQTKTVTKKIKTGETKATVPVKIKVPPKGIFGFLKKETEEIIYETQTVETFEERQFEETALEKDYYKKKENLIKYLKAWVEILEESRRPEIKELSKTQLQEELLKAVSNEDYETAGEIRDLIATK